MTFIYEIEQQYKQSSSELKKTKEVDTWNTCSMNKYISIFISLQFYDTIFFCKFYLTEKEECFVIRAF